MNNRAVPTLRLHLSLVLLSAALIGFQLEQMQILAIVQWHHFAYLVISVALLGFGAAGTCLALFQAVLLRNVRFLLPFCMFCCAIMMALALPVSLSLVARFDVSLLFLDPGQSGLLLAGQLIYLLVFFLGALPLGLVFVHYSSRIGGLYCANLIGSGIGAVTVVALMYFLLPQQMPGLTALLPWIAGLLVTPWGRFRLLLAGAMSLQFIVAVIYSPPELQPSQYKALNRIMDLPGARIVASIPSPYGLVQLVKASALRYAPGLSLAYGDEVEEVAAAVLNNGDWFGGMKVGDRALLDSTIGALPYALGGRNRVLVLEARTGTDIVHALFNGVPRITAVEPHRKAVEAVIEGYDRDSNSSPFGNPAVEVRFLTPRTWLAVDNQRYDLIVLPTVGSFGGSSGLFALQEQYLLTREALLETWHHLSQGGVLRVSTWLDSPARNSLRLAATIAETLDEAGAAIPSHVAAVRGWDMITFVVKRTPFSPEEIRQIRSFCDRLQFDPVILPGLDPEERQRYHFSSDGSFLDHLDRVVSSQRRVFYEEYDFSVRPVTDNRPFFSQFLRWRSIPHLLRLFGERTTPFLELGYVLVLIGFGQMVLAALLLILLPLFRLGLPGRQGVQRWIIPFFSGLGLGYMFFEIVMIHELVLFFGHPIFAAAAVISGLLIFSGLGSLCSHRLTPGRLNHARAAFLVSLFLLLYFFILQPILNSTIGLPVTWKILVFLVLIAPPAFAMGMPFPLGLAKLADHSKSQAAWAWGINGSVSVVSAGLAAIIAVELGFSAIMLIACGAYGMAAMSGTGRGKGMAVS